METHTYDTTIELLGVPCGVSVVYTVGPNGFLQIQNVYGPSGKDMFDQLQSRGMGKNAYLSVTYATHKLLGSVPFRLRWIGISALSELYDEVHYAHESGR